MLPKLRSHPLRRRHKSSSDRLKDGDHFYVAALEILAPGVLVLRKRYFERLHQGALGVLRARHALGSQHDAPAGVRPHAVREGLGHAQLHDILGTLDELA